MVAVDALHVARQVAEISAARNVKAVHFGELEAGVESVQYLVQRGILEQCETAFGECTLAVNWAKVKWGSSLQIGKPVRVADVDRCVMNYWSLSKVESMVACFRQGGTPARHVCPEPLVPGGPLTFFVSNLFRSQAYWVCVLLRDVIFGKGVTEIHHDQTVNYYLCLYRLPGVALLEICGRPDFGVLTDRDFQRFLKGWHVDSRLAMLADAQDGGESDGDAALQPDQEDHDVAPMPERRIEALQSLVALRVEIPMERLMRAEGWPTIKVHFDFWSHQSGMRRAYIVCEPHKCEACFKYTMLHLFLSEEKCCAWLAAWCDGGTLPGIDCKEAHKWYYPSDEAVDVIYKRYFG